MVSTKEYSELVEILYAAPLDEAQWQQFLNRLCAITRSAVGFFLRNDSALGNRMLAAGGAKAPPEPSEVYRTSHRYTDPFRQAFMQNPRIGVIEGEDLVPHERWIRTATYREVAAPSGLLYMTCIAISIDARTHELISLWRSDERPRLEPDCIDLLTMLIPHLQQALRIRRALGTMVNRVDCLEAILDAGATASILLDANCRIVHRNESAERLMVQADGIRLEDCRVLATDPSSRLELSTLVAQCAATGMGVPGGALVLRRSGGRRPLQILVTPLRLPGSQRSAVRVLMLATDPDRAVSFPDVVLRQLYDLTPAETEIANGLLTGFSVDEIARLRGVSVATVRSQMKSLLGKTGTRRQGDLVRLLSTLPQTAATAPN